MDDKEGSLDRRVGYRLKEAQSALRGRMDDSLREVGLSVPQYATLELIRRSPGASNAQLARDAFITRQSMNTMLRSLQRRGLIDRAEATAGSREMPTRLTPDGVALLRAGEVHVTAIETEMLAGFTVEQRQGLLDGLDAVIDALQHGAAE